MTAMTGNDQEGRVTMSGMPDHAKTPAPKDHLWVLLIIAACALLELVASWVTIGAMSGFPRIGGAHGLPTDWVLAVTTEAFWGYALYAWLAGAPGPRSRRFAMCSAAVVFTLSLVGQGSAHLVTPGTKPPAALVVFITDLPVLVLALIAILIHLRQTDREEISKAERRAAEAEKQAAIERAEADERTALRAELEEFAERFAVAETALDAAGLRAADAVADRAAAAALRDEVDALAARLTETETARDEAEQRAVNAEEKADRLSRRLAAADRRKPGAGKAANGTRKTAATAVPKDIDARTEALLILDAEPNITGTELGERVGKSERWGQDFKKKLAAHVAGGEATENEETS